MAVSFVGIADAAGASATLPAFNADDIAFVFAFRDGSTTAPTAPAGWTNIDSRGANTCSYRCGYRQLIVSDTTTGTWTNATDLVVVVLRGVDIGLLGLWTTNTTSGASASMNFAALGAFADQTGRAWVLLMGGHRTATDVNTVALSGTTNRNPATTTVAAHTKASTTTWSATAKTVNANSGWETISIEIPADGEHDRISQAPVEVVVQPTDAHLRLSQGPVEVVDATDAPARLSQMGVEIVGQYDRAAVVSQLGVEVVWHWIPPAGLGFQAYIID